MRFQIILALGLVGLASASPLVDKKLASSLKVVDIPADLFAEASENVETEKAPEEPVVSDSVAPESVSQAEKDTPEVKVDEANPPPNVEVTEPKGDDDKKDGFTPDKTGEDEDIDRHNFFGFRLPTVVILRRPAIFDDPFSSFPFFSSPFGRRPLFGGAVPTPDNRDGHEESTKTAVENAPSPSEQRPISIGNNAGIGDIMHGVRQQMDSLFSTLFAPNQGFFPNRQFFPRPFFPAGPADSTSSEDELDFDKLPNNYKNSTSETKVVDGQIVEVNKTVHKISGNNSNGFFQFSIIKVRPSNPTPVEAEEEKPVESSNVSPAAIETAEANREATTIKAQQEAEMNNPSLNEVLDQDEKESMIANTKYDVDPGLLQQESSGPVALPLVEEIIYDFVPVGEKQSTKGKPLELSSDLRVNSLMEKADSARLRTLVDPDEVEVISV